MSCSTIYIVRERDGRLRYDWQKWGPVEHASPDDLLAHFATLNLAPARPGFLRGYCRGWYIDRERRFARVYFCNNNRDVEVGDWPGWDVAEAFEGRHDIATLVGEPEQVDDHAQWLDAWRGCAAAKLVTANDDNMFPHRWDPMRRELRYCWYWHDGFDLSVIDHDGFVVDYGFTDPHALFAALGHGLVLLDELATFTPCPNLCASAGAVIDVQQMAIHIWHRASIAPATYAALHARWPGWTIAREVGDFAGALQRTGRSDELFPPPYDDEPRALSYLRRVEVPEAEI